MDHDAITSAACAASDLAARFVGELQRARQDLRLAERRFRVAAEAAMAQGTPIPLAGRRTLNDARRQLAALEQLLADVPGTGGCDAKSA